MSLPIIYVANARLPSQKAHPYQIVQMCDAFADQGFDVELVVPERRQRSDAPDGSIKEYFDTPVDFDVTRVWCIDLLWALPQLPTFVGRPVFYLQSLTFTIAALLYVFRRRIDSIVYSRALLFTVVGSVLFGDSLVVEIHRRPPPLGGRIVGQSLDRLRGVVVISEGLRREWAPLTSASILVEPDGVWPGRFDLDHSRQRLRTDLSLPIEDTIVTYAGSLQPWKGVETLLRATDHLPANVVVCVVGGTAREQSRLREGVPFKSDAVLFVEHVPPDLVPRYLLASDILVLPNTASQAISAKYTSPLKLFEYMAAGRPIVASDVPSIREVLDEDTAYLFTPDDPVALADAVERVLRDDNEADRVAKQAMERVEQFTWQARVDRLMAALCDPSHGKVEPREVGGR